MTHTAALLARGTAHHTSARAMAAMKKWHADLGHGGAMPFNIPFTIKMGTPEFITAFIVGWNVWKDEEEMKKE